MRLSYEVFRAVRAVIVERVRVLDDTECHNPQVSQEMADERALLMAGLGELVVAQSLYGARCQ
jgi:hypothetical protein